MMNTPRSTFPEGEPPEGNAALEIDPVTLERFVQELRARQNLVLGCLAGVCAAMVAAVLWAVITAATGYQIGWMAVGVGFLVGVAVRHFGQGIETVYGIAGAVLSLLGCLAGNLLAVAIIVANDKSLPFVQVLMAFLSAPVATAQVMAATFSPIDLIFYAIALYEGYTFSFRRLREAELVAMVKSSE